MGRLNGRLNVSEIHPDEGRKGGLAGGSFWKYMRIIWEMASSWPLTPKEFGGINEAEMLQGAEG